MGKFLNLFNPDNPGKMLLTLNALGIAFAAASNTVAAATDKNTSAEDKKFLVPAGAATGVANLGIYYLLTNNLIKRLKNNAENSIKKISPDTLKQNALELANKNIAKAQKGFLGTGLFKKSDEYINSMKSTLIGTDGKATTQAVEAYTKNIKEGAGVLGAFIGAVVGCAIITPIIRDISSYFVQKKMGKKIKPELQTKISRPYLNNPIENNTSHINKNPMNMNSYMNYARQGMKI